GQSACKCRDLRGSVVAVGAGGCRADSEIRRRRVGCALVRLTQRSCAPNFVFVVTHFVCPSRRFAVRPDNLGNLAGRIQCQVPRPSSGLGARGRDFLIRFQQTVDREWSRSSKTQGNEAGKIQQVGFITGLTEVSAGGVKRLQLDGAESVRQMNRKNRNKKNNGHWNRRKRDQSARQDHQPADKYNNDGRLAQNGGNWKPQGMQHVDEILLPALELCKAVLHKAEADDEPQRQRIPVRRYRQW